MLNGRIRKKRTNFAQVSNFALRDSDLSLKAKGLYSLIESYITLEDFIIYKNTLKKVCKEGDKAFEGAWQELKKAGYLVQHKHRKPDGSYYYDYELLDQTPKKEGVDNAGVENRPSGKRGLYNNTDLTNTDLNNTDEKKIYIHQQADDYIKTYSFLFQKKFNKQHMLITDRQLNYIEWAISEIKQLHDLSEFTKAVKQHFDNLPKSNNGSIIAFLETSKRHFDVDTRQEQWFNI